MNSKRTDQALAVAYTSHHCPIGEKIGKQGMKQSKIPVLSCEGACIRGEIARQAANMIAKEKPFARGCHGELFTVPDSSIARWIKAARQVVVIDGCFLRCHGRILDRMLERDRLVQFDALAVHKKYHDVFDAEDVPEAERRATARQVADHVLSRLNWGPEPRADTMDALGCCGSQKL